MQREEKIWLVYFRGEEWRSQGNRDTTPYTTTFDHNIQSMAQGMTPVLRAGEHLRRVMNSDNCSPDWRVQLYVSPYVHTRLMFHKLRRRFLKKMIIGVREESQVRELDFGNFMIKVIKKIYKRFRKFFYKKRISISHLLKRNWNFTFLVV